MSKIKKNEVAVVQNAEPSLGKVAENENFLKDRKALESQIKRAMLQAENPEYHQRLLDLNPQDYAELSNIKWLFNHDRLRSQQEIDDVCVAAKYYSNYNKPRPFGQSIIGNFFIALIIFLCLTGVAVSKNFDLTDTIIHPVWLVKRIFMPNSHFKNLEDFKTELDFDFLVSYHKNYGAVVFGYSYNTFSKTYPYHPKGPPIKTCSISWDIVIRILCLLYLQLLLTFSFKDTISVIVNNS